MDLTTHLRTFTAVVRCGGFSEAARQLGVVPSLVAKRISQLEGEVQARLFERTTRRVSLTDAGEKLYQRAAGVVGEFEDLLASVQRDEGKPEGHLRVMAPTTFTMVKLADLFCAFLASHPRITMEVVLVDRSINPLEEGFDLAITGRATNYDGVVDVPLCPVRPLLCASPAFMASCPPLQHPRELADIDCLVFAPTGTNWTFLSAKGTVSVDVRCRLLADDNQTLLQAARRGLGVAAIPYYVLAQALESGELQLLLPGYSPQENWFRANVPKRKLGSSRVQALLDFLKTSLNDGLEGKSPARTSRSAR